MENRSGVRGLKAYPKCQFMTKQMKINSSADHHIRATIKNLAASLPEPNSRVTGRGREFHIPVCSGRFAIRFGLMLGR